MAESGVESQELDFSQLNLWSMPASAGNVGFYMPGHNNARFFPVQYAQRLVALDTTELSISDDLHEPTGPAKRAMAHSSSIYGSGQTVFVTTGSTTGIQVMLATVAAPDTFLLIPRTVHMSVLHSLALLGVDYAFLPSTGRLIDSSYLFPQVIVSDIREALALYPQTTDILIVSPDYYGQCADIEQLALIAHEHGCRLLVDEAHGAHFTFAKNIFPPDAMSSGSDMCVQSLHKTLPALTMASQIHVSCAAVTKKRVDMSRLWSMLKLFETSSPSFMIAASAEYGVYWMEKYGANALAQQVDAIQKLVSDLEPYLGIQSIMTEDTAQRDRLRLVLRTDTLGLTGIEVATMLEKKGIYIEFADLFRLVFIVSPWQSQSDFEALAAGIQSIAKVSSDMPHTDNSHWVDTDRLFSKIITRRPQSAYSVKTALFGQSDYDLINLDQGCGHISAVPIVPYPPGIPLLWPGEIIESDHILLISQLLTLGISVRGITHNKIKIIK